MLSYLEITTRNPEMSVDAIQRLGVESEKTLRPLADDGVAGPKTRGGSYLDPCTLDLGCKAVLEAWHDIQTPGGLRESGGNNRGEYVARLFGKPFVKGKSYGPWCAAYMSDLVRRSMSDPPKSWGARKLGGKLLKILGKCDPMTLASGCVAVWQRSFSTWKGHIGLVISVTEDHVWICEGNGKAKSGVVRAYCYPRHNPNRGKGNALLFYTNPV